MNYPYSMLYPNLNYYNFPIYVTSNIFMMEHQFINYLYANVNNEFKPVFLLTK
jgi:hypothetical protein